MLNEPMHCLNTLVCGAEAQASWSKLLRDALSTSLLQVTAYVHGAAELLGVQIDAAINSELMFCCCSADLMCSCAG